MASNTLGRVILPTNGVAITLDVVEDDSRHISLHTDGIEILLASVTPNDSLEPKTEQSSDIEHNEDMQTTTMAFESTFKKGTSITLAIDFKYNLKAGGCGGFYRSEYTAFDGSKKVIASTNMQPIDARKKVMLSDLEVEDIDRASYFDRVTTATLKGIADKKYTALSNMNVISEEPVGETMVRYKYATTPVMSTYLVCFVVAEYSYIESNDFHVPIRVYTDSGKEERGRYALELAVQSLTLYEETFGIEYPLPKLDLVVVENGGGAMENWGLITFAELSLLVDKDTGTIRDKGIVSTTVLHELAHQWFGNLVTMDFWDGLWLNEGFVTWVASYAENLFNPEWKVWEKYLSHSFDRALKLDSLRSSHPVEVPVKNAAGIKQTFDDIAYQKGCAVVRMISQYLGEDVFFEGIRLYIKRHAYNNTTTTDLWNALSTASGKDVAAIAAIWTGVVGHPIIQVTETSSGITLQQNRFLQTADVRPEEDETIYPVITKLITGNGTEEGVHFATRTLDLPLESHDFFKLNKSHNGIFRTLYTPERLLKLGDAMQKGLLGVEDRIGLVIDTKALAASGYQKTSALLGLLSRLGPETSANVWSIMLDTLNLIQGTFEFTSTPLFEGLRKFKCALTAPRAHALGWDIPQGSDPLVIKNKVDLFRAAGTSGDERIIAEAKKMFRAYSADGDKSAMPSDLRAAALPLALKDGTEADYDIMLKVFHTSQDASERMDVLKSLCTVTEPKLVARTLDLSMSDTLKNMEVLYLFAFLSHSNPTSAKGGWEWFKNNWEFFNGKLNYSSGMPFMGYVLQYMLEPLVSVEAIDDIRAFFSNKDTERFQQTLDQTLDQLSVSLEWVKRDGEDVEQWLRAEGYMAQ